MRTPILDVAVGVVQSQDGRVLVAERTARQMAAGFWELPGGKIEPGETPAQAAARELLEEVGVRAVGLAPWLEYEHRFPTRHLRLHFFRMQGWEGVPQGREGQRLAWINPSRPDVGPILPSNDRALLALSLPALYPIVHFGTPDRPEDFLGQLRTELSRGASLVRARVRAVSPGQAANLLARAGAVASAFPRARVVADGAMEARRAGLAGVHSCACALRRLTQRPLVEVWGATCHSEADVQRATALGADFVVLSDIFADPAEPGRVSLGWDGLRRIAAASRVSVYAHGGLGEEHVPMARQAGAVGVSVVRASANGRAAEPAGTKSSSPLGRRAVAFAA